MYDLEQAESAHKFPLVNKVMKNSSTRNYSGYTKKKEVSKPTLKSSEKKQEQPPTSPRRNVKVSTVRDKYQTGEGIKWDGIMKKLADESKGLKQKLKQVTTSRHKKLIQEIPSLPDAELKELLPLLQAFTTRHQSHHRPIALVTSGGTCSDLEVKTVRFLDNFSTGTRGAISVEEFLKRGYAVIHLWREGSAAPYSRVLSKLLGAKQANHSLGFDALGMLFQGQGLDDLVQEDEKLNGDQDPWLTSTQQKHKKSVSSDMLDDHQNSIHNRMLLQKRILNSTLLQTKLRERANVVKEGLLLTVKFRTLEEYLAKLKVCAEAINDCQSLGLIYLTAAVSDFYIPHEEKVVHKIQSRDYNLKDGGEADDEKDTSGGTTPSGSAIHMDTKTNCLNLKLSPVPKLIPLLRDDYAPNAFCVSFKLETDKNILIEKAKIAINKYDVHMVIGNELETRYDKVFVLQNRGIYISHEEDNDISVEEISKSSASNYSTDDLEDAMISHVVEKHFEYIANHYLGGTGVNETSGNGDVIPTTALMSGAEAAARHNAYLKEKKRQLQNELYWQRVRDVTLSIAGHAIGMYFTYIASSAVQKRMR